MSHGDASEGAVRCVGGFAVLGHVEAERFVAADAQRDDDADELEDREGADATEGAGGEDGDELIDELAGITEQ